VNFRVRLVCVVSVLVFAVSALAVDKRVPSVTSISPPSGSINGGQDVIIHGAYFQPGATVVVGAGGPLTNVVVVGEGVITGTTSARAAGVVNVVVTNPDGAIGRLLKAFTYTDGSCCRYPSFSTVGLTGASNQPPASVMAGNYSGDGQTDLVAPANDFNAYYVGNGTPQMAPVQTFASLGNTAGTEVLDLNGDNIDDVALAALGGDVTVFLGDATIPFGQQRTIPSTAHAFSLESADFNSDGVRDLVIPNHLNGNVTICLGTFGGGGCAVSSTYSIGTSASGVAAGDFNGDHHLDIAASNDDAGTVTILLGNGTGSFAEGDTIAAGASSTDVMGLAIGYLDDDGVLDLAVSTGAVLLGDGGGEFTAAAPLPMSNGRHVAISDFNGDGKRDIAIDTSLTAVHVMLGDGNGGFVSGPTIAVPGGLYDAFAALDVAADGVMDLAIGGSPVIAFNTLMTCPTITVGPSTLLEGAVGDQYNVTFTANGGAGVTTFKVTAGTLPAGLSLVGGTLSGTPSQTGVFPITITATDANGCSASRSYNLQISLCTTCPPVITSAFADTLSTVQLTWTAVEGADWYEVTRSTQGNPPTHVASPAVTTYVDSAASGQIYIYRVRAVHNNQNGPDSAPAIASTIGFDDAFTPQVMPIKASHLTELRAAVNAVRDAANLAPYAFTDPNPVGVTVKGLHVQELRTALSAARAAIGVPSLTFTNTLAVGTWIRAIDFTEIRNGLE